MSEHGGELRGFSRIICRDDVPIAGLDLKLEANEKIRDLLVKRFDLLALNSFTAHVVVEPWRKKGLQVEGTFSADAVQPCVVSLAPVPAILNEKFCLHFRPVEPTNGGEREVSVNPLDEEPPEPLAEEGFDLGEIVAEQLALALEPYPRAPGAEVDSDVGSDEILGKKANPFEVLRKLKVEDDE